MLVLQIIFLCCLFGLSAGDKSDWSYENTSDWSNHYTNCKHKKQSPINIVKSNVQYSKSLNDSLRFMKYNTAGAGNNFLVKNNGHTLEIDVSSVGASINLTTHGIYNLAQFHLHWGINDRKGSEHQIDSKPYPAEIHLVHYKNSFSNVANAKSKSGGLAVLGIWIMIGTENAVFKKFLDLSKFNVTASGTNVTIDAFKIEDLLPKNTNKFYRYEGSLTTPTCDETVTWTLFELPIEVSKNQLKKLRKLMSRGKYMVNNYRDVQTLDDRSVSSSFDNAGSSIKASFFIISLFTLFIVAFFSA